MDLKKYRAWSPGQGAANIEHGNKFSRMLKPWKSTIAIVTLVGVIGAAVYATIIRPMNHIEDWQKVQKRNRAGINQEAVQPGGMRVWSNPFEPRKD